MSNDEDRRSLTGELIAARETSRRTRRTTTSLTGTPLPTGDGALTAWVGRLQNRSLRRAMEEYDRLIQATTEATLSAAELAGATEHYEVALMRLRRLPNTLEVEQKVQDLEHQMRVDRLRVQAATMRQAAEEAEAKAGISTPEPTEEPPQAHEEERLATESQDSLSAEEAEFVAATGADTGSAIRDLMTKEHHEKKAQLKAKGVLTDPIEALLDAKLAEALAIVEEHYGSQNA